MNVLSLFDGMSCGQIALNRANIQYDNYFASEIDKWAIKVTQHNYPNTIQLGDVNNWNTWNLPKIDLIIAGSPCQGFSQSGAGLGFDDPRSKLFFKFVEILKFYNPKHFLFENVRMKKEWKDIITSHLGVEPIEIDSALVSAQSRKRLYWTNIQNINPISDKNLLLKNVIESSVINEKYFVISSHAGHIKNPYNKSGCLTGGGHSGGNHSDMTLIMQNGRLRRLTPTEWERLQTVSVGYTACVSNSQRYKMLGNGWTVDVIAHIFSGLKNETN